MKSLGRNKISVCSSATNECKIPDMPTFNNLKNNEIAIVVNVKKSWYRTFINYFKNLFKGKV